MIRRFAILFAVLVTCVGCDQSTKHIARNALEPGEVHSYLGDSIRVVYSENTGAFLGLGSTLSSGVRTSLFLVLPGIFLFGVLAYALSKRNISRTELAAAALLVGGGLGNLIDRALNDGAVVDFLNVGLGALRTGIFNVADMALMLSVAMFLWTSRRAA